MTYNNEVHNSNHGIGFVGLLQVALIVLKLCKVINWSWLIVMLPSIISISLVAIVLVIYLIVIYKRGY